MLSTKLTESFASRRYVRVLALAVACALSSPLLAQQPLDPLSASEIEQAKMVFLDDARVKGKVGHAAGFRIVNVERHEYPKGRELTEERAADVVAYVYNTDEAISAVVTLTSKVVTNMVAVMGLQPSLSPEELAEATELAIANPTVAARLASAGVDQKSLIVTHLFVTGVRARPSCALHRCVRLFFNTSDRALNITPIVDLSARAVEVP